MPDFHEILKFVLIVLICIVTVIILMIVAIIIDLKTRGDYNKVLKLVITSLGDDLIGSLKNLPENQMNMLLHNYLNDNSDENYSKLLKHFIKKSNHYNIYSSLSLTFPAFVIKVLFVELIKEQLSQEYKKGFILDLKTLTNLDEIAPIVKNYCLIVILEENKYYVDIIVSDKLTTIELSANQTIKKYLEDKTKNKVLYSGSVITPKKIVIICKKSSYEYKIMYGGEDFLSVCLYYGDYKLVSLILTENIVEYGVIGGNDMTSNDLEIIRTCYSRYTKEFMSVYVLKKV